MRLRQVFIFWLPLFASWLLLTLEGPIITASINRLPDEVLMLAAAGIVLSLSVVIESPIITMLSTATALVRDRQSFLMVRRFTVHWMIALTLLTIIIAFTPVFDVVVSRWLGAPENVALWVRPGMQIMTLWSAAIAWRRFLQGVLIRFDRTRSVSWGTAIRLVCSGGLAIGLAAWSGWPGVIVGAIAWMGGVVSEAIYISFAVRPLLRNELAEGAAHSGRKPLTYRRLFWFHLPLAGTSVLTLMAQPLVTFSLARLDNPTLSLAAWPLVFQILLITRAPALALPETVIALSDRPDNFRTLRRFTMMLAGLSVITMAIVVFSPVATFYLTQIQDADQAVVTVALRGLGLFLLLPALTVVISWLRGLLINQEATPAVNWGTVINLAVTAVVLAAGVLLNVPGIPAAAVALTLALVIELAFLWQRTRQILAMPLLTSSPT